MRKDILAFVGPSQSGKNTLIIDMLAMYPEKVGVSMSVTTRSWRGSDDDIFYRFMSKEAFEALVKDGGFAHWVAHAGNYYGTPRADVDATLATKYAAGAFVEQGVMNLRNADYTVRVIKIRPVGHVQSTDPKRQVEDAVRDQIDIHPEIVIENDFSPGGRERAAAQLAHYIEALP